MHTFIVKPEEKHELYMLPMGTMPPNPTELLFSDRMQSSITQLRQEFDYIFLDCPPAELVADAEIISRHADLTLFVVRAGLMPRAILPEVDRMYESRRFNNLGILLNGTVSAGRYGYKYGYRYGSYGYGKTYGYGGYAKE